MKGYPKWFTANLVHADVFLLFVTGAVLIPTTLNARLEWDMVWRVGADMRLWVTALHVLFGLITFVVIGALSSIHMRYWWRKNIGRKSGVLLISFFAVLALSSIVILYSGNESLTLSSSLVHTVLGILFAVPYLWHAVIAKRWRAT